ncbi:MAG: hypothetical protein MHM6MM_009131 [Cercozoa sp. M6MM]
MFDAVRDHPTASYAQRRAMIDGLPREIGGASDKEHAPYREQVLMTWSEKGDVNSRVEFTIKAASGWDESFLEWVRSRPVEAVVETSSGEDEDEFE